MSELSSTSLNNVAGRMIRLPEETVDVEQAVDTSTEPTTQKDDTIHCRACTFPITRGRWAIERHGAFEHRFRNPAGWSFQVGCYAKAPGAQAAGDPTSEDSWFAGYLWNYAVCGKCGAHLGWWYIGPAAFAGLIVTRLQ